MCERKLQRLSYHVGETTILPVCYYRKENQVTCTLNSDKGTKTWKKSDDGLDFANVHCPHSMQFHVISYTAIGWHSSVFGIIKIGLK